MVIDDIIILVCFFIMAGITIATSIVAFYLAVELRKWKNGEKKLS